MLTITYVSEQVIKHGFYYSVKSKSYWRVDDVTDGKVLVINMVESSKHKEFSIDDFNNAIESKQMNLNEKFTSMYKYFNRIK